jgi:hypothetical protein
MNETTTVRLDRYYQLRRLGRTLHHTVMKLLPREALKECGMRLGIWHHDTLVFGSEDETCILMDHCIYDYRWDGRNVIERYVAETPPQPGTDEKVLLDAMLEAHYSLFEIEQVHRGVGVRVRDLIRDGGERFLVDISMSQTVWPSRLLATRIKTPAGEGYSMTTGAALPVDEPEAERILREVSRRFGPPPIQLPRERAAEFSGCIMRILLQEDASSRIAYTDPPGQGTLHAPAKAGRNDPCPCGSGRKYKRCCGQSAAG